MTKTIDISAKYKPEKQRKLLTTSPLDDTIKVTFSNPSTIVIFHSVNTENEVDITKDDFNLVLKKIARPVKLDERATK